MSPEPHWINMVRIALGTSGVSASSEPDQQFLTKIQGQIFFIFNALKSFFIRYKTKALHLFYEVKYSSFHTPPNQHTQTFRNKTQQQRRTDCYCTILTSNDNYLGGNP